MALNRNSRPELRQTARAQPAWETPADNAREISWGQVGTTHVCTFRPMADRPHDARIAQRVLLHIDAGCILVSGINIGNENKEALRWRTTQLRATASNLVLEGQLGALRGNGDFWLVYFGFGGVHCPH